jgi:hypothetical protein
MKEAQSSRPDVQYARTWHASEEGCSLLLSDF